MKIVHTCLRVEDLDRSVEWYEENFGFEETWSWTWEMDEGLIENRYVADDDGMELQLQEAEGQTEFEEGSLWDHFGVRVDDLEAALEGMNDPDVVMEGTNPNSGVHFAFVTDPDGHRIELLEPIEDD